METSDNKNDLVVEDIALWIRDNNMEWEDFYKKCDKFDLINKGLFYLFLLFIIVGLCCIKIISLSYAKNDPTEYQPCLAVDCSLCDKECPTEPCPPPVPCPEMTPCPPCPPPVANQPVFEPVLFDYNAYDIKHYFIDKAKRVIEYLKENPDKAVILYGNTDDKGNISYNKQLAERRVNSVKKYFVQQGIESGRIRTKTFGEHKSSQSNETQSGRLKNRRVEFEIKDYPWQD